MGRGGPELPESIEEARELLSGREFFIPRSDLPAESDERREYVRRLHVVLARMARQFEHARQVLSGERPVDSEPTLPDGSAAAEEYLGGQSFFVPAGELPDDADSIGQYVERLHIEVARASRALEYNRQRLQKRRAGDGSDGTTAAATSTGESTGDTDSDRPAGEGAETQSAVDPAGDGDANSGTDETAVSEASDGTTGETGTGTEVSNDEMGDHGGFVFGETGGADTGQGANRSDGAEGRQRRADSAGDDADAGETVSGDEGMSRRRLMLGGSVAGVLAAVLGGGLAAFLLTESDDGTDGGDDGATPASSDEGANPSGGDDTDTGDGGSTGDDGGGGPDDGSNGRTGQEGAFELTAFGVTGEPDEEYVELTYTGESERDISGYLLYDSEGGLADPTAQGTLDPFAFPEGTVLSPDASVRVYTGQGEDSDGVFYWGYEVNIWNQSGDTVILEDASGSVVFEGRYGPQR